MRWPPFKRKRFYAGLIVLAAVVCLTSDILAYIHLGQRREMVLSGIENYRANPDLNSPLNDPLTKQADPKEEEFQKDTLARAIAGHVYRLPARQ
jgi:hypothetical protein